MNCLSDGTQWLFSLLLQNKITSTETYRTNGFNFRKSRQKQTHNWNHPVIRHFYYKGKWTTPITSNK